MPFDRFEFTKDWTAGPDEGDRYFPAYQDSENQVRADLQLLPNELKNAIHALLDKLESAEAAGLIGGGKKGTLEATLADLYTEVQRVENDLKTLAAGGAPEAVRTAVVGFDAGAWEVTSGGYAMTVSQKIHGRNSYAFGYQLWAEVGGVLRSDVWYASGTCVEYVPTNGNIVLTAEEPYAGRVAFFGV